jgi:hypothetical protein
MDAAVIQSPPKMVAITNMATAANNAVGLFDRGWPGAALRHLAERKRGRTLRLRCERSEPLGLAFAVALALRSCPCAALAL